MDLVCHIEGGMYVREQGAEERCLGPRETRWEGSGGHCSDETREMRRENIREGDHLEDLGVDGTSLEWVLKESIRRASTELM